MMRRVTSRLRDRIAGRDSWHFAKERFVGGKDIIRPSSLFGDARPAMLDALHHGDGHLKGVHVGKAISISHQAYMPEALLEPLNDLSNKTPRPSCLWLVIPVCRADGSVPMSFGPV
jgi:hypothetical protein